jgi:hypothetical protein
MAYFKKIQGEMNMLFKEKKNQEVEVMHDYKDIEDKLRKIDSKVGSLLSDIQHHNARDLIDRITKSILM